MGLLDAHCRELIESAMDAIIVVDDAHRVVLFNRSAERTFGVPAVDALGGGLDRFIPERFRGSHAGQMRSFAASRVTRRSMGLLGTIAGLRADGSEFPMEASISHFEVEGRTHLAVILRDISERRRLESQLLQAQKMEVVGRLAGGIAHDFNNMLMAMFNFLALATRELPEGHAARGSIAQAIAAGERAADLTRRLLTFSRKRAPAPGVVSVREVVRGLEPMLRRVIAEDVRIRVALSPDVGSALSDAGQLEQVLMNLVINARDAMPGGGTLTIEASNQVLDEDYCRTLVGVSPGEYVMLAVTDTGVGMTPEVQAQAFEPFFTTKEPGKGTGLGLATSLGIVRGVGGHIAVYSEPGAGTSVKVYLPRVDAGGAAPRAARDAGVVPHGSETVLVVEDEPTIREQVALGLREAGYRVLLAGDGVDALVAAGAHAGEIHALVTDVVVPGMSGIRLAQELATTRPRLAVVFMSGYPAESVEARGMDPSTCEFVSKPFAVDDLLRRLRAAIDRRRAE